MYCIKVIEILHRMFPCFGYLHMFGLACGFAPPIPRGPLHLPHTLHLWHEVEHPRQEDQQIKQLKHAEWVMELFSFL
jgi:hypothetical protein